MTLHVNGASLPAPLCLCCGSQGLQYLYSRLHSGITAAILDCTGHSPPAQPGYGYTVVYRYSGGSCTIHLFSH